MMINAHINRESDYMTDKLSGAEIAAIATFGFGSSVHLRAQLERYKLEGVVIFDVPTSKGYV